jgi:hypothetical protein
MSRVLGIGWRNHDDTDEDFDETVNKILELRAEVERLAASRDRWRAAAGRTAYTLCPECGPAVQADEDGCCICCGNGAMGAYATERAEALRSAEAADLDAERDLRGSKVTP